MSHCERLILCRLGNVPRKRTASLLLRCERLMRFASAMFHEKRSDTSLQSEQKSNSPLSFLCALLPRFSFGHSLASCENGRHNSNVAVRQQLVSSPSGKAKYFHPPQNVKGLYYNVAIRIARLLPYLYLSLRGATDFVATWQSRGSAIVARVLSSRLPRHLTCTTNSLFFQ